MENLEHKIRAKFSSMSLSECYIYLASFEEAFNNINNINGNYDEFKLNRDKNMVARKVLKEIIAEKSVAFLNTL